MLYCFLDTNIFLQYQMIDDIDWTSELQSKEVCLVVAKKVIQELDRHKRDPISNRRRKRARKVLKILEEYGEPPIRENVYVTIQTSGVSHEWLVSHGYDPNDADDCIVGAAHYFKEENSDNQVILFADDSGARLKARAMGIAYRIPSDSIKLPDEPDPTQKRLSIVEQELSAMKNAMPRLSIGFLSNDNEVKQEIAFSVNFDEQSMSTHQINEMVEVERQYCKYEEAEIDDAYAQLTKRLLKRTPPTQNDIVNYETEVNEYLINYKQYLTEASTYNVNQVRMRSFILVVTNSGKKPANDIDINLHFPDGFDLFDEEISQPNPPNRPIKPMPTSPLDHLLGSSSSLSSMIPYLISPSSENYDSMYHVDSDSGPTIIKGGSYDVHDHRDNLKHHHTWEWSPLFITFDKPSKLPRVFRVKYKITAANIPDPVQGTLRIRLS
jgi:hypothetical protein